MNRTEYFREYRKKNRDHLNAYKAEWARKDRRKKARKLSIPIPS